MRIIRTILSELLGLFVDDAGYVFAIVVWLGIGWAALPRLPVGADWKGAILFLGLVAILVESVMRRSRQR